MSDLYRLVYMSRAARAATAADVLAILQVARSRNAALQVTGLLLYGGGSFIQTLEGPRVAVEAIFQSILKDERHSWVSVLVREDVDARSFPDWSMGFERLPAATLTGTFEADPAVMRRKLDAAPAHIQDVMLGFGDAAARA